MASVQAALDDHGQPPELSALFAECERQRQRILELEARVHKAEDRRRALLHIMSDLHSINRRLGDQRKAILHILEDYEQDRRHLIHHGIRLDNSRRALLHIIKDAHRSKMQLEHGRKAMIHIMGDLRETTLEVQRRESDLRDKQEQLVQAGKLATLGELTTGIAHELNNPLNNISLFVGNAIDRIRMGSIRDADLLPDLSSAVQQIRKATEIISHLRTFGRAAPVSRERMAVNDVIERALSLVREQLRLRQIVVDLRLCEERPMVLGNAIQLEQVFVNLLTNARDAVTDQPRKEIRIESEVRDDEVLVVVADTGTGIPREFEKRIFDPFFTTKQVGAGTGLGLSITYGIIKSHKGTISVRNRPGRGAAFVIHLPRLLEPSPEDQAS